MSTPERPEFASWRDRIPPQALAEADRLGPVRNDGKETPEDRAARLALQREHRAARWRSRLPIMYEHASLDDLRNDDEQREVAALLDDWPASGALNLVIAGPVGTGKTHAAYAVGNTLVACGVWCEAWTVADLLAALRPEGDRNAASTVRDAEVLVLDDLGATKVSEWAVETMTSLLDARLREGLRTIVTTNLPGVQVITDAWGGRFADRLMYRAAHAVMVGPSRRREAW